MAQQDSRDHLVKSQLVRSAGLSATGAHQVMQGLVVTDPQDREALRQYLQALHLGDPLLMRGKCGKKCNGFYAA